jgi:hypothetical protein
MRLFELAYCCRLYGERVPDDPSLSHFRQATGGTVDLSRPAHRALLLDWLRRWGCRNLRTADDRRTSRALRDWWETWGAGLPGPEVGLHALDDDAVLTASLAYAALAQSVGPRRAHGDRLVDVRFGSTAAAKAMFGLRPHAFPPWDAAIRRALGFGEDADSYRRALVRARDGLRQAVREAGVDPAALPALLGRPDSTAAKLIDEHDVMRYTTGHEPPTRAELERWLSWA